MQYWMTALGTELSSQNRLYEHWFLNVSCLGKESWYWKGITKFSCCYLAIDIQRCRAGCCAEQSPLSMGRFGALYRARKKKGCIGRKQESILQLGAWNYNDITIFPAICEAQILWFVWWLHTLRLPVESTGNTWSGGRIFLNIFLVLQSRKWAAEPHPWFIMVNAGVAFVHMLKSYICSVSLSDGLPVATDSISYPSSLSIPPPTAGYTA